MPVSSSHPADFAAQVLHAWRDGTEHSKLPENPHLGMLLGKGSAHQVFLIAPSEQYVIRIRRHPSSPNDDLVTREIAAWRAAANANLAPRILHESPDRRAVVTERLSFGHVSLDARSGLLREIHQLPYTTDRLFLAESAKHYWELLRKKGLSAQAVSPEWGPIQEDLKLLDEDTAYFCHNDLTPTNIGFREGKALAIDWEYAAMGSRYFDVAIASESIGSASRIDFAKSVLMTDFDESLWKAACRVASVINHLWELAREGSLRAAPSREQLLRLWMQ